MCICVFQTSPRFNCSSDADCQKHLGSVLANGEHELWFKPFNCPEGSRRTHDHRSCFAVIQVQLRGSASHPLSPPIKPRASVRSRDGVRLSRKTGRCKMCSRRSWKPSACPPHLSPVVLSSNPMLDVNNFTIFIKNSIRFPHFNVVRWVHQAAKLLKAASFLILNPTASVSEGIFPPR